MCHLLTLTNITIHCNILDTTILFTRLLLPFGKSSVKCHFPTKGNTSRYILEVEMYAWSVSLCKYHRCENIHNASHGENLLSLSKYHTWNGISKVKNICQDPMKVELSMKCLTWMEQHKAWSEQMMSHELYSQKLSWVNTDNRSHNKNAYQVCSVLHILMIVGQWNLYILVNSRIHCSQKNLILPLFT